MHHHTENLDYTEVSTTNTFAAGINESCTNIVINDDPNLEGTQSFTLTLVSAGDQSVEFGPISNATVQIFDNDGKHSI